MKKMFFILVLFAASQSGNARDKVNRSSEFSKERSYSGNASIFEAKQKKKKSSQIYARDLIFIKNIPGLKKYIIQNAEGKTIVENSSSRNYINISRLPSGKYSVSVTNPVETKTFRFTKK